MGLSIEDASFANGKDLTEQVNNSVVVAGEQSDEISEEQHEGAVDHAVVQVGRSHLEILKKVI
jgi:hypothetical protein